MSDVISRRPVATIVSLAAIAISVCAIAGQSPRTGIQADDSDLDLSTWTGLMVLYQRLQDASMSTCDPSGQARVLPYFNRPDSGDCYSDTLHTLLTQYENVGMLDVHNRLRLAPIIVE